MTSKNALDRQILNHLPLNVKCRDNVTNLDFIMFFPAATGQNFRVFGHALKTDARRDIDIEHELLEALLHLRVSQLVVANKRRQISIEIRECLGASRFTLQRIKKVYDLTESTPKVLGGITLNLFAHALESLDQEILEVPTATVGGEQAEIMDMEIGVNMSGADILRIHLVEPITSRDRRGDIVVEPLDRETHVAVLFESPVGAAKIIFHQFVIRNGGVDIAHLAMLIAVQDISLGFLDQLILDQDLLNYILDLLDRRNTARMKLLIQAHDHLISHLLSQMMVIRTHGDSRLVDCPDYLGLIEVNNFAGAFD